MNVNEPATEGLDTLSRQVPDANPAPYALAGRVVTMGTDGVFDDGVVFVGGGVIADVRHRSDGPPDGFGDAPVIETNATMYPGLIDLHNHLGYNVCTLWAVPKLYKNRDEWNSDPDYAASVKGPVKRLAENVVTARAMVRYVEAKALVNGTSTGQGMRLAYLKKNSVEVFRGAMRNVEAPQDSRLRGAQTRIPDLDVRDIQAVNAFRSNLDSYSAFLYHLCEGRDEAARQHFLGLVSLDFIKPSLVGIHALALTSTDYARMKAAGAKLVWSPFSNMLLYGSTLNLRDVLETDNAPSLGCDWSPSGSKGLLEELKVARHSADTQYLRDALSDEELVQMVTTTPANALGWGDVVGSLQPSRLADVLVIRGVEGDPYTQLIAARERDVQLLVIDGIARYGDPELVGNVLSAGSGDAGGLDVVEIDSTTKAFNLTTSTSPINELTVSAATTILLKAVEDLDNLPTPDATEGLAPMDTDDGFTLLLDDMDGSEPKGDWGIGLAPLTIEPVKSIPLDSLVVDVEHLKAVALQNNIPQGLTQFLCECYGVDVATLFQTPAAS